MTTKLDCRNMDCPQPVLMVKEAYEALPDDGILDVRLNSFSSKENVKRYAKNNGIYLKITSETKEEAVFTLVKGYTCDIEPQTQESDKSWVALFLGSIVTGILASTCCLGPFLFLLFGVSAESVGWMSFLAPYHDYFTLISVGVLAYLWYDYIAHRRKKLHCETWLSKNYFKLLIIGTIIVAVLISYQYWMSYFIGD